MDFKVENKDIGRYCRQMILPEIGRKGQCELRDVKVLLIGAGGLASGCAMPLAGAGVGTIGIVDGDCIEESNLHRQILHSTLKVGQNKAESAKDAILAFNPNVKVNTYKEYLTTANCIEISKGYDILIDCTDNPKARYLVNDTACILNVPLVSGAAIKFAGQLTVYNKATLDKEEKSEVPCYRCLFPIPAPPTAFCSCSDGGVLGTVPTTIGTMQATEAIKIITGQEGVLAKKMIVYNAIECSFRKITLRGKNKGCIACGEKREITAESISAYDYDKFLLGNEEATPIRMDLPEENNISWEEYLKVKESGVSIDVRDKDQFDVFSLEGFKQIPFREAAEVIQSSNQKTFVMCRSGNKSTHVVSSCLEKGAKEVFNIKNGMKGYKETIDADIPMF